MRDFFRSGKFKVLVCIFALLFGFMIYAAISAGAATIPERALNAVTQPFVQLGTAISDWVRGTLDTLVNADTYKRENETLKKQLSDMYTQIIDKEATDSENASLREMLKIAQDNEDYEWSAPCSVIARSSGDISGGFTINRGSNDGIALYDPVFTEIGLVGMVTEISTTYARVSTILSTDVNVGIVTAVSKDVGIVENDIKYSSEGLCLVSNIPKDSKVKVGEAIITAGSVVFPEGLIVGTVEEIFNDDNGLSCHATIKPSEDVFSLNTVYVITAFDGQGIDIE